MLTTGTTYMVVKHYVEQTVERCAGATGRTRIDWADSPHLFFKQFLMETVIRD